MTLFALEIHRSQADLNVYDTLEPTMDNTTSRTPMKIYKNGTKHTYMGTDPQFGTTPGYLTRRQSPSLIRILGEVDACSTLQISDEKGYSHLIAKIQALQDSVGDENDCTDLHEQF